MPCFDGRDSVPTVTVESGVQTSRLCAVFKALELQGHLTYTLNAVDWKKAGVSKESTLAWWERHKREDVARLKRERNALSKEQKRREILAKLSDADLKILNLNRS